MVLPVHNDAEMLNQTIRSVYALRPDEVLFALDRCTDATEEVIHRASRLGSSTRIISFDEGDGRGWAFRSAYMRRELYAYARNDTIVNTSADLNLDPVIRGHLRLLPRFGLVSFGYLDRWTLSTFTGRLHQVLRRDGFGGLLALSRGAWLESEDLEDLKKCPQGEDDHLHYAISQKHPTCHVVTRSLHLRPNNNAKDDYLCGIDTAKQNAKLGRVLYRTIRDLRPSFLVGYIHAKNYGGDLNDMITQVKKKW